MSHHFELKIPSREGHLVGKLVVITGANGVENKLCIILHGLLNHKESFVVNGIEQGLDKTYNTFTFDFTGNGLSSGKSTYSDYEQQVQDVIQVLSYFKQNGFNFENNGIQVVTKEQGIRFNVEVIIGHSKGGSIALLLASNLDCNLNVPYIINISGRVDLREKSMARFEPEQLEKIGKGKEVVWKVGPKNRKIFISNNDFLWRDKFNLDIYNNINNQPNIKGMVTIHGMKDKVVKYQDAILIKEMIKINHQVFILEGVSHFFDKQGEIDQLVSIINQYLLNNKTKL
ncbi:alpha/beta-hydrolase [Neoconidiobolus thromboides FSU 785]|nr:alpha/beta-hydrolase [Neoconidiobolus thromboides FSU 785]